MMKWICLWSTNVIAATQLLATVFYIDPAVGNINYAGSSTEPWSTLQEVFENNLFETQSYQPLPVGPTSELVTKNAGAPIKSGDTLMLRTGYHGSIFYRGAYNLDYITIMAEPGHSPIVGNIQLSACKKWIVDGITISPEGAMSFYYSNLFFVESHPYHGPSRDMIIRNCILKGIGDASSWGLTEWNDVGSCIIMKGNDMVVESNLCLNIDEGINIGGDSCQVRHNRIVNFAGDGMRGQGSYLLFEYNTVKNCYDVNGNHDDGFQSFTTNGVPFTNNILRGNTFINFEDPNQPFRGTLQGIGCFDGPYVNWIVENNVVAVNHYHGISLYGAENCRIINNTVVDIDLQNEPNGTWIRVTDHKNGTPSDSCIIQNNLSFGFSYGSETTFQNNLQLTDYSHFKDPSNHDYRLKSGSSAINGGWNSGAPTADIDGISRPQQSTVDLGAYEFNSTYPCQGDVWIVEQSIYQSQRAFLAAHIATTGPVRIAPYTHQDWYAQNYIQLNPGFEIPISVTFQANIGGCD